MNYARTALLLAAMTGLFLAVGYVTGGEGGMAIAFVLALGMNLFAYWNSDRMVLSMHGGREVGRAEAPELYDTVAELAARASLPMPRVYVMQNDQPNAFATGRNPEHAAVAATTGLLSLLTREELSGVIAHELAHVKNRDTLTMTITATIAGAIGMLANFAFLFGGHRDSEGRSHPLGLVGGLLAMLLAPIAASLVQFAISRSREYAADQIGGEICGQPLWLASALQKLHRGVSQIDNPTAERSPASAHLFIVNPLHGGARDSLFSTHPAMENRVARLEAQAASMGGRTPALAAAAPWPQRRRRGPWG